MLSLEPDLAQTGGRHEFEAADSASGVNARPFGGDLQDGGSHNQR